MPGMRYQPQGLARLNAAHSLVASLQLAFIPGLGDVSRKRTSTTSPSVGASRFGRSTPPLNTGPYPTFESPDIKTSGNFSVVIVGDFTSPISFTAPLFSHYNGYGGWKFGITSGGVVGYTDFGVADYAGMTVLNGMSGVVGMSYTPGRTVRVFTDGKFREAISVGSMNGGPGASFTVGNRVGGTDSGSASRVAMALYFDRALTDDEQRLLAVNPWSIFYSHDEDDDLAEAVSSYLLSIAGGALSMAGGQTGLRVSRRLRAAPAALAVTAGPVAMRAARRLRVDPEALAVLAGPTRMLVSRRFGVQPASLAVAGQGVALRAGRRMQVAPMSLAIAGGPVAMQYSPALLPGAYTLPVSAAAMTLGGGNVGMRVSRRLSVAPVGLVLAVGAARLLTGRRLVVSPAALAQSASQVEIRMARRMRVQPSQLVLAGGNVQLRHSSQIEYARAPAGAGYAPQRTTVRARPTQTGGHRPPATQETTR